MEGYRSAEDETQYIQKCLGRVLEGVISKLIHDAVEITLSWAGRGL